MSKHRYINTRFWNDNYIANLDPIEKLLFIYFLSNEHTNICGIYELPLKIIGIETGIDREHLQNVLLPRLEKDKKIFYRNGWIAITNFIKYQATNPSIEKGIEKELKLVPDELKMSILDSVGTASPQAGTYSILFNSINNNLAKTPSKDIDDKDITYSSLEENELIRTPKRGRNAQAMAFCIWYGDEVRKLRGTDAPYEGGGYYKAKELLESTKKWDLEKLKDLAQFFFELDKFEKSPMITACLSADTIRRFKEDNKSDNLIYDKPHR